MDPLQQLDQILAKRYFRMLALEWKGRVVVIANVRAHALLLSNSDPSVLIREEPMTVRGLSYRVDRFQGDSVVVWLEHQGIRARLDLLGFDLFTPGFDLDDQAELERLARELWQHEHNEGMIDNSAVRAQALRAAIDQLMFKKDVGVAVAHVHLQRSNDYVSEFQGFIRSDCHGDMAMWRRRDVLAEMAHAVYAANNTTPSAQ